MPLVATFRQPHGSIVLPEIEIARHELAAPGVDLLEAPQLSQPHRGGDIREIRLSSGDERIETVDARLDLPVPPLELDRFQLVRRASRDRPSFERRDVLVGMKAEAHEVAKAADTAPTPAGADRMCGVLDHPQLASGRDLVEAVHIDRQTCEVDGHDGPRAWRDGSLDLIEINVAGIQTHVDEDRPSPYTDNNIGSGDEAQGRCNDLITGPDTTRAQRHLQAGGRGGLSPYRPAPEILRELPFELGYFRAGREPSGAQHFDDGLDGLLVEGGARKRQHLRHDQPLMSGPREPRRQRSRRHR